MYSCSPFQVFGLRILLWKTTHERDFPASKVYSSFSSPKVFSTDSSTDFSTNSSTDSPDLYTLFFVSQRESCFFPCMCFSDNSIERHASFHFELFIHRRGRRCSTEEKNRRTSSLWSLRSFSLRFPSSYFTRLWSLEVGWLVFHSKRNCLVLLPSSLPRFSCHSRHKKLFSTSSSNLLVSRHFTTLRVSWLFCHTSWRTFISGSLRIQDLKKTHQQTRKS